MKWAKAFTGWARTFLIVNLALVLVSLGLWLIAWQQGLFWRADFTMLYTGGALVRDGRGAQLYDLALQAQYQQQILEGKSFWDGLLPFNYPPYVALLIAPLSALPLSTAYVVWTLTQIGLLGWLLRRLWQLTRDWTFQERLACLFTVLAFTPMLNTFLLGSFSLLLLVSWVEGYVQLKALREGRAGLWLALGALKPQSVLAFGLAILGARRWRVLASLAGIGCLLFFITTLFFGFPIWLDFLSLLVEVSNIYDRMGIVLCDMHNFRAVLAGLLGPEQLPLINTLGLLAFAGTILWTLWAWRGTWALDAPEFELRVAVTCALGLFFSLHLYPQDSLLWVFPAFLGYEYLREQSSSHPWFALFLLNWPWFFLLDQFASFRVFGIRPAISLSIGLLSWLSILMMQANRSKGSSVSTVNVNPQGR